MYESKGHGVGRRCYFNKCILDIISDGFCCQSRQDIKTPSQCTYIGVCVNCCCSLALGASESLVIYVCLSVCLSARRSFNSMQACRLFPDPVVIGSGRASPGALRVNLFIFSPMKHDLLNNRMWTRAREYQRGYMATRRTTGKVDAAGRTGKAEL